MRRTWAIVGAVLTTVAGCGSDDDGASGPPIEQDAAADVVDGGSDAKADVTEVPDASPDVSDASSEPETAKPEPQSYDAGAYVPTPTDVLFKAVAPLPSGEQMLLGDWSSTPNALYSMPAQGGALTKIFEVHRIWSFGVSSDGNKIAFSCGDPKQEEHYGLTLGDVLQHTWVYDAATQQIELLTHGNINEECHQYGPDGKYLYLCRRWDFAFDGEWWTNKGYSIGRVDLATREFSLLSQDPQDILTLHAAPNADESSLLYTRVTMEPPNKATYDIMRKALPDGAPELVRGEAGGAVLSPDGTRYAYTNYAEGGAIYVVNLDGSANTKLVGEKGIELTWSPDGTRIAYLADHETLPCAHVDVVKADGTEAPVRVRDCTQPNDFVTELAWIIRP